ncbi:VOC family protein [Alkalicoccobacillus porphyridii]|uniref:Ring-cleaving dioxygenase n=1 Tax=Alkalicoccobacillus porphyridii TaxID=2597270 RepID=A0A553ZZ22_9BACI|nr:ring-cleaving dioxygenase [Alkalicoccobacillus porphyridii]TSB46636.1 ring-cleaving dioxygenase [Alkalicoccobacillus porphyridii]
MRIQKLTLLTNQLDEMKKFYHHHLHFELIHSGKDSFSVQVGASILVFKRNSDSTTPFYHFAMNIPKNQLQEAKKWLTSITKLNTQDGYDEVFFKNWNAHAIYFTDPAGNILELIARHEDIIQESYSPFHSKRIINISEIGIVTHQVQQLAQKINLMGIQNARLGSEEFAPLGDAEGLFIIVKDQRTWYFSDQPARFFPVHVVVENVGEFVFQSMNEVHLHHDLPA